MARNFRYAADNWDRKAFEEERQKHHEVFMGQNPGIAENYARELEVAVAKHGISYLKKDGSVLVLAPASTGSE